jgi:hypothetical protein
LTSEDHKNQLHDLSREAELSRSLQNTPQTDLCRINRPIDAADLNPKPRRQGCRTSRRQPTGPTAILSRSCCRCLQAAVDADAVRGDRGALRAESTREPNDERTAFPRQPNSAASTPAVDSGPTLPLASKRLPAPIGEPSPKSGGWSTLLGALGSLAVVLGLFLVVVWFLRRTGPKSMTALPGEVFEVLGRSPLAARQQRNSSAAATNCCCFPLPRAEPKRSPKSPIRPKSSGSPACANKPGPTANGVISQLVLAIRQRRAIAYPAGFAWQSFRPKPFAPHVHGGRRCVTNPRTSRPCRRAFAFGA